MKTSSLLCCLLLIGCAGITEIAHHATTALDAQDYAKLCGIAYQLVSGETLPQNDTLAGNVQTMVNWYEATKVGWKAASAILSGVRSRDVRTTEVVNLFYEDTR